MKPRRKKGIFDWEIVQGERQEGLDFVDNVFCKAQIKGNL